MDEDLVSAYLLKKLSSHILEAEAELGGSSSIISLFRSLKKEMEESSARQCRIPEPLLYEVMEELWKWRMFSYKRPTAEAALSSKRFFYLMGVLHHLLSGFWHKRRLSKQLEQIKKKIESLSPAVAPVQAQAPVVPQTPISDIIGFEKQAAQIDEWLTLSSSNAFTEIVITGKWGCGKTALAHKVFATPSIENSFSPLIWVPLSGTMHEQEARETVVKYTEEKIGKVDELNGKRYLMVLDDWPGEVHLNLPKGSGGALILTTRQEDDFGTDHNHVIRLEPQLSDEICWQIFSKAAHLRPNFDPAEAMLSSIQKDVVRNTRGRALAVKTLGTIFPNLLLQRERWLPARKLGITWGHDTRYWKWTNLPPPQDLPPPQEMEEVAELRNVYWLEIKGSLELHKLLVNRTYSAYLVYKLNEEPYNLDVEMKARVRIVSKGKEEARPLWEGERSICIDSEATEKSGWMEIDLGEFVNYNDFKAHSPLVEARLFHNGSWKSGLIVKGIGFRLKSSTDGDQ